MYLLEMAAGAGTAAAGVIAAAGIMILLDLAARLSGVGIAVNLLRQVQPLLGHIDIGTGASADGLHHALQAQADHQRHGNADGKAGQQRAGQ